MKKIAIIGAGAVGATLAYYLSKEKDIQVTVFDYGVGQQLRLLRGLLAHGFQNVVIKPGIVWRGWGLIFIQS